MMAYIYIALAFLLTVFFHWSDPEVMSFSDRFTQNLVLWLFFYHAWWELKGKKR